MGRVPVNIPLEIRQAHQRISDKILNTPLMYSHWLSKACEGTVYVKLENEQYTGSFKARGSLNKLMWLRERHNAMLPVTASTGNHGLGFARALHLLEMSGKIFLPKNTVPSKIEAIEAYNADIEFHGEDPYTTELFVRKTAKKNDWKYVSPYNDLQVLAGQGTIGIEVLEKIKEPDNIFATVGGGGLISGIASYIKSRSPDTNIFGCQPANSPEMSVSVRAGEYRHVDSRPTLSDGSAGGFVRDSITFGLCKKLVDDFILVSEEEIKDAIRKMIMYHHKVIEGSAGVAIASLLQQPKRFTGQTSVIISCGANIPLDKLKTIL